MRNWRPMTWITLAVNVAIAVWLIVALGYDDPCDLRGEAVAECAGAERSGRGIGVVTILGLWVLIDIALAGLWMLTARRESSK